MGRIRRRNRPVRRDVLQHLPPRSPSHRSPAAHPARTRLGSAGGRADPPCQTGRLARRRIHGDLSRRILGPAAVRRTFADRHAHQHGRHAEHRGKPDLILPGPEGPEHRGGHGLLLVIDRHPPGLPRHPGRDVHGRARRRRQSAADPPDDMWIRAGADAVAGWALQGLRPGGERVRTQRRRGHRGAETPVRRGGGRRCGLRGHSRVRD